MSYSYMGYYFLPDAIASINDIENEEERHRAESEARESEQLQKVGRVAALSGDLELIVALSPTQFEYTMAAILRMLGMTEIQRVGGRGHFGVEITARDPSGHTMLVRCKRRARTKKIGSPAIQKFVEMAHLHHHADLKMFVTTSEYTDRAQALSQLRGIQLMDGSGIEDLARTQRSSTP